jgi:hypothetical protein
MDAIQAGFGCSDLENPPVFLAKARRGGEAYKDALRVNSNVAGLKLEFNETKVTSNAGKKLKLVAIRVRF